MSEASEVPRDEDAEIAQLLFGGAAEGRDDEKIDQDVKPDTDAASAAPGLQEDEPPSGADSGNGKDTADDALDDGEAKPAAPITSFKKLAEAAGVDMEKLYDLTVGFGDGTEPMKLGAMKDAIKNGLDLDARASTLDDTETRFQNEVMRVRGELNQLAAMFPATPEQQERARVQFDSILQREQTALLEAVPQLANDPDFRKATHDGVTGLAAEYGVTRHEIDNLTDHRIYKMAMDFAALRARVDKANAAAKKLRKGSGQGPGNARAETGAKGKTSRLEATAKRTGLENDQLAAIASLIG